MKKLAILILLSLCCSRCGSDLETKADLNYVVQIDLQAGLNPFTIWEAAIGNIPTQRLEQLANAGVAESEVEKIVGKVGLLSTVFNGVELDFIREIAIEVYSDNPEDSTEILYREVVPDNTGATLGLNASLPDVQRHLNGEFFGVIVRITPRWTLAQTVRMQLDFTLGVL